MRYKDETGYGIIPKKLIRDPEISVEAKAIYAYLTTYAGVDRTAYPGMDLMEHDLQISQRRIRKHRKQLVDKGYLGIKQIRTETGFSHNVYTLKVGEIEEKVTKEDQGAQNVHTQNVHTQNVHAQNSPINTTSINTTSINTTRENTKQKKEAGKPASVSSKNEEELKERFETIWQQYPKKQAKQRAYNHYKKAIKDKVTDQEIQEGLDRYLLEIERKQTPDRFIKKGGNWFGERGWEDEFSQEEAQPAAFANTVDDWIN